MIKNKILCGALVAALACGVGGSLAAEVKELTIVSWGGAYTKSQDNAYINPIPKKPASTLSMTIHPPRPSPSYAP